MPIWVLLAMGFLGPERGGMLEALGVRMTDRGNVWRDENWMTSVPGVFTAGDMQRGQSLIVWAIAEGRSAARGVRPVPDGHLGPSCPSSVTRFSGAMPDRLSVRFHPPQLGVDARPGGTSMPRVLVN